MTSHHVTCHVTVVSCASSLSKRKIKEKKNKIISVQASHNKRSMGLRIYILLQNNSKSLLSDHSEYFENYNDFITDWWSLHTVLAISFSYLSNWFPH